MKIVIIDDSKAMRLIILRTLRQAGFGDSTVLEGSNGKEGLDLVMAENPDLVISDWNMPEMNGLELLNELRNRKKMVKFGFVTTEGTPAMRKTAMDAGALFLITKPFTPETFRETLAPLFA
jgi:two-component system chemotaxis response regulator CheY